jgi:Tol biopolymer transport system component
LSADGRFTAFTSLANNLTPEDDNNNASDIFLHDALDDSIIRISVGPNGEGNGDSFHPALSGDGRFIAFATLADNLAPGSDNGVSDILLYHLETGALERVSGANGQSANGASRRPVVSADGRFIAFQSAASNLVAGDNNGAADIFVFDRQTGAMERVSLNASGAEANGESHSPAISGDGRYVLFVSSATNLSSITANPLENVYLRDRQTGTTTLISVGLDGQAANIHSGAPAISQDGRIIAFQSSASNLVENDNNNAADIFVYERETGRITAVSLNNHGHLGNRSSGAPTLSADGRFVAFTSFAGNFSPISQLGYGSVYLRDRQTRITEQISRGYQGEEADGSSVGAVVSSDGRYVLFDSTAGNLLPGFNNNRVDIFRFDRAPQTDLSLSDAAGQPGSYFTLDGADFPPGQMVALSVNGRSLGEITVEADGSFTAVLDSSQANPGLYVTTAAVNLLRVHAHFLLAADAPLRANPGGSALLIPPGIGLDNAVYLPILGNQ